MLNRWKIVLPMWKYSYVNAIIKEMCDYHDVNFMMVHVFIPISDKNKIKDGIR